MPRVDPLTWYHLFRLLDVLRQRRMQLYLWRDGARLWSEAAENIVGIHHGNG